MELTRKFACALTRRKVNAALARLADIEVMFGDVDMFLQRSAVNFVEAVRKQAADFDAEMRECCDEVAE